MNKKNKPNLDIQFLFLGMIIGYFTTFDLLGLVVGAFFGMVFSELYRGLK